MLSVLNKINSAMAWVGIVSVLVLVVLVAHDVFMRYVLNNPTQGTTEAAKGIQLLYGLVCAGYVLREGGHIRMQLLIDNVSPKKQARMLMIASFFGIFMCGTLAYYAWLMAEASLRMHERVVLLEYPVFFLKLIVVIGFSLLCIQFIAETYKYYRLLKGGNSDTA